MPTTIGKTPELTASERLCAVARGIPAGRVASYGQVADLAGLPGRARMVGAAFGRDPQRDELPWHRVLRADGRLAFPAGSAHYRKQRDQLRAEGVVVTNGRVDMARFRWQPSLIDLAFGLPF